jgi:hypothetical protein
MAKLQAQSNFEWVINDDPAAVAESGS